MKRIKKLLKLIFIIGFVRLYMNKRKGYGGFKMKRNRKLFNSVLVLCLISSTMITAFGSNYVKASNYSHYEGVGIKENKVADNQDSGEESEIHELSVQHFTDSYMEYLEESYEKSIAELCTELLNDEYSYKAEINELCAEFLENGYTYEGDDSGLYGSTPLCVGEKLLKAL